MPRRTTPTNNTNAMSTHYYTGSNNSTYLRSRRSAASLLSATRGALDLLRGELMGEGEVSIYDSPTDDFPVLTFERSIHTGYRTVRTDARGKRTVRL